MSKKTRTVALFIVLSMAAVSCQKENLFEIEGYPTEVTVSRTVSYMIDGTLYHATLHSDAEWDALMHRLMALAREGHRVMIANGNSVNTSSLAKDVVIFRTSSEEEANEWIKQMTEAGYTVTYGFDDETQQWICIAEM